MSPDDLNPYAAPAADTPPEGALPRPEVAGKYGPYRNTRRLAVVVSVFLAIGLLLNVTRGGLNLAYTLTDFGNNAGLVERIEGIMTVLGSSGLLCFIFFGIWIVRSAKNAWLFAEYSRRPGQSGFRVQQDVPADTPGWAVGWYFIPIANLWKPYTAMRDLVRASTLHRSLPPFLLPTWWGLWVGSNLTDNAPRLLNGPFAEWNTAALAVAWASVSGVAVALHLMAMMLIRAVTDLQADTAAALAAQAAAPEPHEPIPAGFS